MVAMLHTKNLYSKTRQGVRAKFSEQFIKTSILPVEVADDIALLFKYRQQADYDFETNLSADEARELIKKATSILQQTKHYLIQINT